MNSCIPGKKKRMQCFDLEGKNGVGKNKTLLLWAATKTKHLLKTSAHFPVKKVLRRMLYSCIASSHPGVKPDTILESGGGGGGHYNNV